MVYQKHNCVYMLVCVHTCVSVWFLDAIWKANYIKHINSTISKTNPASLQEVRPYILISGSDFTGLT